MADYPILNLVQHACKRPQMFTPTGSLYELYSFFIGFENGFKMMAEFFKYDDGHHYYDSVKSTLTWIKSHEDAESTDGGLASFIDKFGSEDAAMAAILDFASNLPPTKAG